MLALTAQKKEPPAGVKELMWNLFRNLTRTHCQTSSTAPLSLDKVGAAPSDREDDDILGPFVANNETGRSPAMSSNVIRFVPREVFEARYRSRDL